MGSSHGKEDAIEGFDSPGPWPDTFTWVDCCRFIAKKPEEIAVWRLVPNPVTLCLVASMLLPGQSSAQEELARFDEMVEVSEVMLDVLVTDADGALVKGLGKEDFLIEEDGEEVTITDVDFYSTRYDTSDSKADGIPWSRYFIAFFDDQKRFNRYGTLEIRQQIRASSHARRWVREEMQASDWMAVVRYDGRLKIYQDFSQDRDALEDALGRAAVGRAPSPQRQSQTGLVSLLRRLPEPATRKGKENIYQSIARLAEASGFIVGRKNLLLFTLGFGIEDRATRKTEPDERYYPQMEAMLNDHNVAVYPIDVTPAGRGARQRDFLQRLADDTGGFYDENFVGFLAPIKDVADDNHGYYLLSYQSPRPAGEIGYQRLEVKARRPEFEVRARRGYRYGL